MGNVRKNPKRWSTDITNARRSREAGDLEKGVFTKEDPRKIAMSLRRSARRSKGSPDAQYRWAMSVLCLYANRAGKNLQPERRETLERAKKELRILFGRDFS